MPPGRINDLRDFCFRYFVRVHAAETHPVVMDVLVKARGDGGVIAMDGEAHVATVFNTKSMYRGFAGPDGAPAVAVFRAHEGTQARAPRRRARRLEEVHEPEHAARLINPARGAPRARRRSPL